MFNQLFRKSHTIKKHINAPLLAERLNYLQYLDNGGAVDTSVRENAQYLLIIMKYLNFYELRMVSYRDIEIAANNWATRRNKISEINYDYSNNARTRFIYKASNWLKMLNCLEPSVKNSIPFEEYLVQYIQYARHEQGLSENTIEGKSIIIRDFLNNINKKVELFINVTPLIIDEVLIKKYEIDSYSRKSIQLYSSVIRVFLRYAENKKWCQSNLALSVKAPRIYALESLPSAPHWDDVKKIIALTKTDLPIDIRNHAILMLLSIYGMRCSEVTNLCLEDLDWQNELLYLRRAKGSKLQIFPLSKIVGEAILNYIKNVRPNTCSLREIFVCINSPYRPLSNIAVYRIVSTKLKLLGLQLKHYGPHSLRHACATHLINEEISLKEISDHLGHQSLETTRIYTKVDLTNLRKVTEFELGDVI